ncbi:MAG: PEP-CTERM sorting domain-containing protein [Phycisphaerae bacterium]|nr:PEP-CTERM sorting domain-containing protein [Phycisphaerae bacterium]
MSNRVTVAMVLAGLCVILGPARVTPAPIVNKTILKAYFQTGNTPTEGQFGNLIDSLINDLGDTSLTGVWTDASGGADLLGVGETVGPAGTYGSAAGLSDQWLRSSGFLAMSFLLDDETHYGYLQIEASEDPTSPYPMLVEYLSYENQPDLSIDTVEVPEPTAMALLAVGGLALIRRRRT